MKEERPCLLPPLESNRGEDERERGKERWRFISWPPRLRLLSVLLPHLISDSEGPFSSHAKPKGSSGAEALKETVGDGKTSSYAPVCLGSL